MQFFFQIWTKSPTSLLVPRDWLALEGWYWSRALIIFEIQAKVVFQSLSYEFTPKPFHVCIENLFICIFGGFGYLAKHWFWTFFIQSWMCYIFFIISFHILNKFWGNPLDPYDRVELLKAFLRFWYFQPW